MRGFGHRGSIVSVTTRSATAGSSFGMRDGLVLSRSSPSKPSSAKRSCQRQTQVLDLLVSRMIALVPTLRGQHDDPCSPDVLLRGVPVADQRAEPIEVSR